VIIKKTSFSGGGDIMRKLIKNDLSKCVGCNRCIRVCPIDEANIVFVDGANVKVQIDNEKCIACGACLSTCQHNSRTYDDDTEKFIKDLCSGQTISVFVAPAARANLRNWGRILTWLKGLGARNIFDVSLGADICTWAYIRWIQQNNPKTVISQPCPAIVDYILKHNPSLLPYLSPVHSPMLCTAIYMRYYKKITHKIAAISPCIAKSSEFEETGNMVSYNVTFKKLEEYVVRNCIDLPDEPSCYDHLQSGLGSVYSYPGGLKENVEFFLGKTLRVDKSEGQSVVYNALDMFGKADPENWPVVFDVLNCPEGCNLGTGVFHDRNMFEVGTAMEKARKEALAGREREYFDQMFLDFDDNLRLEDFVRRYYPHPVTRKNVTERDLEEAFLALGKTDELSRIFNCGACGSDTCADMAAKIVRKVNIAENCIQKIHKAMEGEHKAVIDWHDNTKDTLRMLASEVNCIHESSESIKTDMGKLKEVIRAFDIMSREIDKIADNIHIISLNASIEAAKAGDHGKSFAVVAEAVRSLAGKTQTAITKIGKSSEMAKETMNEVDDKVKDIAHKIGNASGNLQDLHNSTGRLSANAA